MTENPSAHGGGAGSTKGPVVFVSDASAEAGRIADTLRVAGYTVLDVPISLLVARLAVQRPHVVLLDVDSENALDVVHALRRVPGAAAIDFVYIGSGAGPVKSADDALANEGSAFFDRPIDVAGLVRKVEALTGGPVSRPPIRPSTPPPSIRPPPGSSFPPPVGRLPSDRPSALGLPSPGSRLIGPPLPMSTTSLADLIEAPRSIATFGVVSSELSQLLADAEVRVEASAIAGEALPTPEEEIEAVLPADVLASLDDPIDDDEHDDTEGMSMRTGSGVHHDRDGTGAHAKGTTAGGTKPPTTGGRSNAQTNERRLPSEAPSFATPAQRTNPRAMHRTSERPAARRSRPPMATVPVEERITRPRPLPPGPPSAPPDRGIEPTPAPVHEGVVLGPGDGARVLADAIARRATGALCFEDQGVVRRVVLRDGDFVAAASGAERETLVHFLGARGDLPQSEVDRLAAKVPAHGRHAGAALVAHGWLVQDRLWETLRAHAEWIASAVLRLSHGTAVLEPDPPGRLRSEPSVFGAATGSEIFVELTRRAITVDEAIDALGGEASRIADGQHQGLLAECALPPPELELVTRARGGSIRDLLARSADAEIAVVVYALVLLGVLDIVAAPDFSRSREESDPGVAALDEEAVRGRIRARMELVDEGDYFTVLGVSREATGYEVRRAFVELRRAFEPSRILNPRLADLEVDVRKIVVVLEEAYEILRDSARRERYRRALDVRPE